MTVISEWALESINLEDVSATDLRREGYEAEQEGSDYAAYRLWHYPTQRVGYLVFFPEAGRAGIADGGDAVWTDAKNAEEALSRWVSDTLIP